MKCCSYKAIFTPWIRIRIWIRIRMEADVDPGLDLK